MTEKTNLHQTFGEEKAKWKINPRPGNDLERWKKDEETTLRLMSLMELDHVKIRNILIDMFEEKKYYDILSEGSCKKEYSNDKPVKVILNFYDSIEISWFGITYNPDHGESIFILNLYTISGILKYFGNLWPD